MNNGYEMKSRFIGTNSIWPLKDKLFADEMSPDASGRIPSRTCGIDNAEKSDAADTY